MPSSEYFSQKAARCRELMVQVREPEIAEQLRVWAEEFELMAEALRGRMIGQAHPSRQSADKQLPLDPARAAFGQRGKPIDPS